MCKWGLTVPVEHGVDGFSVDACLAPLVLTLRAAGVQTEACCCGHGKEIASIRVKRCSAALVRYLGYEPCAVDECLEITIPDVTVMPDPERLARAAWASTRLQMTTDYPGILEALEAAKEEL